MTTPQTHYKAPQSIDPVGFFLGAMAGLAGALLIAPIYALAIAYIPIVYLNALLTGCAGFAIGWGVCTALRAGHFHNAPISYGMALGALGLAYWTHWIMWFAVLAFRSDANVLDALYMLYPPALLSAIGAVYDVGTWSISGGDVNGIPLGITWVLEALIFFGAGLVGALGTVGTGTYCARCKAWCTKIVERRLAFDDGTTLSHALNQRQDWSALLRPAPAEHDPMWYAVFIDQCPSCRETGTLTVNSVVVSHDSKGNREEKATIEVDRVYIAAADVARLTS